MDGKNARGGGNIFGAKKKKGRPTRQCAVALQGRTAWFAIQF